MNSLKIAVIGCGYWGKNHARTLHQLGCLYAVSDINADLANDIAQNLAVRALTSQQVLEDDTIDAVVLALPPQYHTPMALKVIAAKKHIFIEKPMALSIAEAEQLTSAATSSGLIAMTGHVLRFHSAFESLEQAVNDGVIGKITYIHSHRLGLGRFHTQDDALWDIAPHDLSLILALTKEPPSTIKSASAATLNDLSDFSHLHLAFPGGIRAHVFVSRLNPYRERRLTVIGDKAMLVFDDVAPWPQKLVLYRHKVWQDNNGRFQFESKDPEYLAVKEEMPLTKELAHFIDCIVTKNTPRTPLKEGLEVIKILEAGSA